MGLVNANLYNSQNLKILLLSCTSSVHKNTHTLTHTHTHFSNRNKNKQKITQKHTHTQNIREN